MERKPYSAGAVKHSFWFMEFRKVVDLRSKSQESPWKNTYGSPGKTSSGSTDCSGWKA